MQDGVTWKKVMASIVQPIRRESMSKLRIVLYGGEDYRIYDGTRLVATVYAEADLWRFNVQAIETAVPRRDILLSDSII